MRTEDFSALVARVKQAGEIRRGRREPSRVTTISTPDVQKIRGGPGPRSVGVRAHDWR